MQWTLNLPLSPWGSLAALLLVTAGHETGHLLVAKLLRIPLKLIGLGLGPAVWRRSLGDDLEFVLRAVPTGMSISVAGRRDADGRPRRPMEHDMMMAAAGPAASFLLCLALLMLAALTPHPPALRSWLITTAIVSAFLGLFNLIPVPGLDGGHLLVLAVARLGYQLSPGQEKMVHRVGLWLAAVVCMIVLAIRVLGVA